ncbi:bifunctional metallophosphatase/5'-nucleotidase [Siculibacillus lacustris]|uniref:Bifunctional metallophosphatase/5'-nucleotidase n=1 Tax=Siculibacillus lacustris TaxID=1549641 RepID=A0A4Q9VU99_9HYPH|nr:bifunctional metallophosphatase/5'-nucleotidase [Siculibacillus lacustris]TBW39725.1 bifunctional metallophosphatase/5'-nucleotidase [Siculibacillus lacustris]
MKLPSLALALVLSSTALSGACLAADGGPLEVTLLAINDFHGNLKPPAGGIKIRNPADPTKTITVAAGGSEAMATLIKTEKAAKPNAIFVAAGDLVGASPLLSALFADEPTVESLSLMGLEISAVGNHEFDKGSAELLRKQNGGCQSDKACLALHPFLGAKYHYLAASTIDTATGKTLLPPYEIKTFEGIPVGFIGLTLKRTPDMVLPSGVAGLAFRDEAETVNALVPELQAKGVEAIVVLIHEGGAATGNYDDCIGISGAIVDIVGKLDPAVKVVISGHTHRAYICDMGGRLVTSGDKFGTLVTEIDLKIDRGSKRIVEARANNLIVRTDTLAKDPDQTALIATYEKVAGPLIERPVGAIAATITKTQAPSGESSLGNLIADAQLAATRGPAQGAAVIAVTNPGGVRTDLVKKHDGAPVTYGDVFAVQPFANNLVTITLTGADLHEALEQQWSDPNNPRLLQPSAGFSYTWDAAKPIGERVDPASITLDGRPIDPAARYRVTLNNFLADGGDGFKVFRKGTDAVTGVFDVDALEAFLKTAGVVEAPALGRIRRLN